MPAIKQAFHFIRVDTVEFSTENESLKSKRVSTDDNWFEVFKARLLKFIDDEKRANLFMSTMWKLMKNNEGIMTYIGHDKLLRSDFHNNVSSKDGVQDLLTSTN